jgi:hypothetical protein
METKTEKKTSLVKSGFDTVKMMRNIRSKIDENLESLSPKQRRKYYQKQKEEFEEWKAARKL